VNKALTVAEVDKITFGDLHANIGTALVLRKLEISFDGRPEQTILAGVGQKNQDSSCWTQIRYHYGRGTWQLLHEKASEFSSPATMVREGLLPDLIDAFEKRLGVTLPETHVIHLGVGLYSSKDRNLTENPFAMKNGETYRVVNKRGVARNFKAQVINNSIQIAVVSAHDELLEFFEPRYILSREEWLSLKHVPGDASLNVCC
jgi:hypothetical protein